MSELTTEMPDFKGAGHLLKEYQDKPATARDPLPNPPHRATRRRREGWACPDLGSGRALSRGQRWPRDRAAFGVSALRVTIPSVIRSPASSSNRSFFPSCSSFVRSDVTAPSSRRGCPPGTARRRRQGWSHRDHPKGLTLMAPSTVPRSDEVGALRAYDLPVEVGRPLALRARVALYRAG